MAGREVRIFNEVLNEVLKGSTGPVAKYSLPQVCEMLVRTAKTIVATSALDTGVLYRSIGYRIVRRGSWGNIGEVYALAPYAEFVEFGTGIYGPLARPIRAPQGKVFAWRDRGTGRMVFSRSIRGRKAIHFMRLAVERTRVKIKV